jgi:protein-tyrosine phosphatase
MSSPPLFRAIPISVFIFGLPMYAASIAGVRNFDQVDEQVYRGAQPSDEGFRSLAKLGVRVVLDLREADDRSTAEERAVTASGMKYVNVPMTGLNPPTTVEITKILALLEDGKAGPVFVHCKRGADRTGAVIAAYQIDFLKWNNARALKDAKSHGMGSFQLPRQEYVRTFQPRAFNAGAKPTGADPVAALATGDGAAKN